MISVNNGLIQVTRIKNPVLINHLTPVLRGIRLSDQTTPSNFAAQLEAAGHIALVEGNQVRATILQSNAQRVYVGTVADFLDAKKRFGVSAHSVAV